MRNRFIALVPAFALALGACSELGTEPVDGPQFSSHTKGVATERGITPTPYPGNFTSFDDTQVCYDLMPLVGGTGETDMIGIKVDPPIGYSDGKLTVSIQPGGRYLDWTLTGGVMHAFIVKGGPNYNLFDYEGTGFGWDKDLFSPKNGRNIPEISHYNFCYTPDVGDNGPQGCTPGYWRNHADRWVEVDPADDFDTTFGVDLFDPNITLGTAIWLGGGGINAFARHATAALLNAWAKADGSLDQFVNYPYTVDQVLQMVLDAVANETIEETKDLFEAANELGCPLSGTPAVPVS